MCLKLLTPEVDDGSH